ncbi:MAG: hypothetical protein ABIJ41_07970 [Candidatus Omnitrophota bacterium]
MPISTCPLMNLSTDLFRDVIIASLVLALIVCLLKIRLLKRNLIREIHQRLIPLLNFEIDKDEMTLYLKNESHCLAKNIKIEDFDVTLKYDFPKTLTLKFPMVELVNPNQRVALKFRAFDETSELDSVTTENLATHLLNASLEAFIYYSNIENTRFQSIIVKNQHHFLIKEARPCL